MRRCARCGVLEPVHVPTGSCPRFEAPAPLWMRAVTRILRRFSS